MNKENFESMIKKYSDELMKMSKEKAFSDTEKENTALSTEKVFLKENESIDILPFEETDTEANKKDAPEQSKEDIVSSDKTKNEATAYASFSARVFTGNNAYPIENAKVLVVKDDSLFTFLTTDRDGITKKVQLPAYPESNSLTPGSENKAVLYTGEIYATDFTPRKDLLISAVGGSDIVLEVQMTPISEREV